MADVPGSRNRDPIIQSGRRQTLALTLAALAMLAVPAQRWRPRTSRPSSRRSSTRCWRRSRSTPMAAVAGADGRHLPAGDRPGRALGQGATNPGRPGAEAVGTGAWDPSVKSLIDFPPVLEMIREAGLDPEARGRLHRAAEGGPRDRPEAARQGRRRRQSPEWRAADGDDAGMGDPPYYIIVRPTNRKIIYAPSYDPGWVYGRWPYPRYSPIYYPFGGALTGARLLLGAGLRRRRCDVRRLELEQRLIFYLQKHQRHRATNIDRSFNRTTSATTDAGSIGPRHRKGRGLPRPRHSRAIWPEPSRRRPAPAVPRSNGSGRATRRARRRRWSRRRRSVPVAPAVLVERVAGRRRRSRWCRRSRWRRSPGGAGRRRWCRRPGGVGGAGRPGGVGAPGGAGRPGGAGGGAGARGGSSNGLSGVNRGQQVNREAQRGRAQQQRARCVGGGGGAAAAAERRRRRKAMSTMMPWRLPGACPVRSVCRRPRWRRRRRLSCAASRRRRRRPTRSPRRSASNDDKAMTAILGSTWHEFAPGSDRDDDEIRAALPQGMGREARDHPGGTGQGAVRRRHDRLGRADPDRQAGQRMALRRRGRAGRRCRRA